MSTRKLKTLDLWILKGTFYTIKIKIIIVAVSMVSMFVFCAGECFADPDDKIWKLYDIVSNFQGSVNNRLADIETRLAKLEGLPDQVKNAQNSISGLKTTTEQYREETTKIKEETAEAAKRLNESLAEANASVKNIKQEQQKTTQSFEDYKKQEEKQKAKERLQEQRQARLNDSLREILTKGVIEEDLTMNDCFRRACEISPEFCKSYDELKEFHKDLIEFLKKAERFSKRFWELFERDKKMQELMDQPRKPAISGGGGDSPVPVLDAPDVKSRDEL